METAESISCLICVFSYLVNYSDGLSYYIPENLAPNTVFGNIGKNADISSLVSESDLNFMEYHFLDNENKYLEYFNVDSKTSDLSVKKKIDRETICEFSSEFSCPVTIKVAAQVSIGSFFQKITLTINIEDVNDNQPYFPEPLLALSFSESDVEGTAIQLDVAIDPDSDNYTVKEYFILPAGVPFRMDYQTDSGDKNLNLVVDGKLDRESVDKYYFHVVAKDGGPSPLNGTMLLNITIEDANDNKPNFSQPIYKVTVKETVMDNTTIAIVHATDLDFGKNAEIVYSLSLQQSQEIRDTFEINATSGELRVIGQLEYSKNNIHQVSVVAMDMGDRPQSSVAVVEVTVVDTENNAPQINVNLLSKSDKAEISEYASVGAAVAYIKVVDDDEGRNGMVSCFTEGKYFGLQALEQKEYKVIVFSSLDRELTETHNVTISCNDFGVPPKSSEAKFTVKIMDENDNPPVFADLDTHASIKENNAEGSTIVQVYARDRDTGENGRISYFLLDEDKTKFSVNAKTGLITARVSFDRENASQHEFQVFAVDGGNPAFSSSTTIYVTIEDENDNRPQFVDDNFTYFLPESQLKETVLGKVTAVDDDDDMNGYVSYSLYGNYTNLPFQVLPDGTVKTTDNLDREVKSQYEFIVKAIDHGTEVRLANYTNVTVIVTDINDNYPNISYPRDPNVMKYITYMIPAKTQIMKIEASDKDEGRFGELSYIIDKRNDTQIFEMGRNGEIYVARKMFENDVDTYTLEITVSDQGAPPKTASTKVTISVLTKNITDLAEESSSDSHQNVVIIVVVIVVTIIIAVAIVAIIFIVCRIDRRKKYTENNNIAHNVHGTGHNDVSQNIPRKMPDISRMYDRPMTPTAPTFDRQAVQKTDGKTKDVTFQDEVHVREKSIDSTESSGHNTQQLHRLTSLRLHQALVQNQDRQWTSQNEITDPSGKDGMSRKQEDVHSDLSNDTGTFDSGMGGSVSESGDVRLTQLQQVVRQSGRRGQPPHKSQPNSYSNPPPKIIARGRTEPPERPPPLPTNPYTSKSRIHSPRFTQTTSPSRFDSSSPTKFSASSPLPFHSSSPAPHITSSSPVPLTSNNLQSFMAPTSEKFSSRFSPTKNTVQDLLMYKRFQNGLRPSNGHIPMEESIDTTHLDDDESTTSGSYYIDNTVDELRHPPVSDIYV